MSRNSIYNLYEDIRVLKKYIASLTKTQWLSVKDNTPPFHTPILFYAGKHIGTLRGEFCRNSHTFRDTNGNKFYKSDISYWTNLPADPTQEKQ
jgi:hypothetical protein